MPNFVVNATVAAGPTPLSATPLVCRRASIIACKGLEGPTANPNATVVMFGRSKAASQQPIELNPGAERSVVPPSGGRQDLAQLFFAVTTDGDGLVVDYE